MSSSIQVNLDDAIANYKKALAIEPKHGESLACLSFGYYEQNELDLAERATVNWIKACPTLASAYNLLGSVYLKRKAYHDALSQFRQALQFDVSHYEAIVNLGQTCMYLYQYQEADTYLKRALMINANSSIVHTYYGINALNQRKFKLARHHLEKAVVLDVDNALAYANLSVVLQYCYCFGSGNAAMREALTRNNKEANFYVQFATNLLLQNHPNKAIKSCQRALQLEPTHKMAHKLLGESLLGVGAYAKAWEEYTWHLQQNTTSLLLSDCPCWNGKPFPGKLLLVYWDIQTEEAVLLLRYLPLLANYGRRVAVACSVTLMPILKQMPDIEHVWSLETDFTRTQTVDLQVPVSLLPALLNTTRETIPAEFPYLPISEDMHRTWESILQHYPQNNLKIGLSWMPAVSPNPAQDVPFCCVWHLG